MSCIPLYSYSKRIILFDHIPGLILDSITDLGDVLEVHYILGQGQVRIEDKPFTLATSTLTTGHHATVTTAAAATATATACSQSIHISSMSFT